MRVTSYFASAIAAFSAIASAQNAFTNPVDGRTLQAGSTVNIMWMPTTQGTVTLLVRSGNPSALNPGTEIASNIPNDGSYSWSVDSTIVAGTDYALEIIDDTNPNIVNYTPQFSIDSSNTVTSLVATASMTMTASATDSPVTSTNLLGMSMTTLTDSMTDSMSMSMTGSATSETAMSSTASSMTAAGTIMATDDNGGNVVEKSGFAAVLALAGVIAVL